MIPHTERLESAVTAMLDELRAQQNREGELSLALVEARHRRGELQRCLTILIKTLPAVDRRRHSKQLTRIDALCRAPRRRPGATEWSDAVLAFLVACPDEEFSVANLNCALVAGGYDTGRDYGAKALYRLARQELVVRVGQGRYRVTYQHPDLAALRRKAFEERGREGWFMDT